jgi:hypothetical protein
MSVRPDRGQAANYPKASDMVLGGPLESKLCEMGCGRNFMRPVPVSAKYGLKWCAACLALPEANRIKQAEDYALRSKRLQHGAM